MRALLLYDENSEDFEGVNLSEQVKNSIQNAGFTVKSRKITSSDFKHCICFGCWVKTPGLCVLPGDEANQINSDMRNRSVVFDVASVKPKKSLLMLSGLPGNQTHKKTHLIDLLSV